MSELVAKAVNGSVRDAMKLSRVVRNRQIQVGAGTAGAGIAGAGVERARGRRRAAATVDAATGGAVTGYSAYHGAGQLASHVNSRSPRPEYMRQGLKRSAATDKKAYDAYQKERGAWLRSARDPQTGIPDRAKQYRNYPKHWPGARVERTLGWTHAGNTGRVVAGALTLGGAVAGVRHQRVKKAVSLRTLGGYARQGWKDPDILVPAIAGGGVTGAGAAADNRRGRGSGRRAAGTAAGAVAGEAAWRGTGLSLRNRGHTLERTLPEGMSRSQRTKILRDHRYTFDPPIREGDKKAIAANPRYSRTYPDALPGSRYKHAVGHMSGKQGMALEAGVVTTGALAGRKLVHRDKRNGVGKRLVYESNKVSKPRAVEFGAGAALLSLGAPRMVGPALSRGAKAAAASGHGKASRALVEIESARRAWLTGTEPMVRKLPKSLQSSLGATAAGGLLAGHAVPVRRKSYTPVVMV